LGNGLPELEMNFGKKAVNKTDLAKHLEQEFKWTRRQTARVINHIFKFIQLNLEKGERIQLSPYGTFETRHRAVHKGRNPKTGEVILIKAKRYVIFKPGKAFQNLAIKK
jgi:nucleoid DNA-binding protein